MVVVSMCKWRFRKQDWCCSLVEKQEVGKVFVRGVLHATYIASGILLYHQSSALGCGRTCIRL